MVGIGAQDDFDFAERFVTATGTTFAMLWSDSFASWNHFGVSSNSSVLLLDAGGNLVGDRSRRFDPGRIEQQLSDLA